VSVRVSRRGSVTISRTASAPRSGADGGYASPPARYSPSSPGYSSSRARGAAGLSPRSQQALTKEIMEVHGAVNAMTARPPVALFRKYGGGGAADGRASERCGSITTACSKEGCGSISLRSPPLDTTSAAAGAHHTSAHSSSRVLLFKTKKVRRC
jgi:hypothetical protein